MTGPRNPEEVKLRRALLVEEMELFRVGLDQVLGSLCQLVHTANVWKWTTPIKVDSHSVIVLEIQFPGGFDSKFNPGEFVLTSVDAQFQGELKPNINDRKPPSAGMPQPESGVGKKASLGVFFPSFRPGSSQG